MEGTPSPTGVSQAPETGSRWDLWGTGAGQAAKTQAPLASPSRVWEGCQFPIPSPKNVFWILGLFSEQLLWAEGLEVWGEAECDPGSRPEPRLLAAQGGLGQAVREIQGSVGGGFIPARRVCVSHWLNSSLHPGGLPFCSSGQGRCFCKLVRGSAWGPAPASSWLKEGVCPTG